MYCTYLLRVCNCCICVPVSHFICVGYHVRPPSLLCNVLSSCSAVRRWRELSAFFPFVAAMATVGRSQGKTFKFVLCTVARHLLCTRRYINIHTTRHIYRYMLFRFVVIDNMCTALRNAICPLQYELWNLFNAVRQ